ncbi:hypothetical protein T492DRAFT_860171, partial [Pavlovales sp. CCMP2436]
EHAQKRREVEVELEDKLSHAKAEARRETEAAERELEKYAEAEAAEAAERAMRDARAKHASEQERLRKEGDEAEAGRRTKRDSLQRDVSNSLGVERIRMLEEGRAELRVIVKNSLKEEEKSMREQLADKLREEAHEGKREAKRQAQEAGQRAREQADSTVADEGAADSEAAEEGAAYRAERLGAARAGVDAKRAGMRSEAETVQRAQAMVEVEAEGAGRDFSAANNVSTNLAGDSGSSEAAMAEAGKAAEENRGALNEAAERR